MTTQTPAPLEGIKPIFQILVLLGLTLISFFLLGMLFALLQQAGMVNVMQFQDAANYSDNKVVKDFRTYQLICDLFLFVIPVAILTFLVSRNRLQYLQMNTIGSFALLFLGAITIIVSLPMINYLGVLNEKIHLPPFLKGLEDTGDAIEVALLSHHTLNDLLMNLLVMALAAAVSEELFFRGAMQKLLISMSKNKHTGVWLTAACFSAIHLQFSGFFPRMLLGVFLGYLYLWSGSIWVNIFAHFTFNGIQILLSYFEDTKLISGTPDKIGSQGSDYIFIIVSTLLVIPLIVFIYRLSKRKAVAELPGSP